ncbi:MAG: hypothetical protein JNL62_09980 [Bryobacterales bacterium]|nr:hypothetical protein [Bryobacterales bacterium]
MFPKPLLVVVGAALCLPAAFSQQPSKRPAGGQTVDIPPQQTPGKPNTTEPVPNNPRDNPPPQQQDRGGGGWIGPTVLGGAAGAAVLGHLLRSEATKISDGGPRVEREFAMNALVVRGFVAGGWPCAVDFALPQGMSAALSVSLKNGTRHLQPLNPAQSVNGVQTFRIPDSFGNLSVATFAMNAQVTAGGTGTVFRLYGIACGPKAVGSINIDRLSFGPSEIRTAVSTESQYGFRAKVPFSKVRVEFMQATPIPNGLKKKRVADETMGRISKSEEPLVRSRKVSKSWNGQYSLQVRAWERGEDGGDWILAWSRDLVSISK